MPTWEDWRDKVKKAAENYQRGILPPPGCYIPQHPGCLLFGAMPGIDCHDCAWSDLEATEG
jgi:hypothetical protein